jgi:hypothetical protein
LNALGTQNLLTPILDSNEQPLIKKEVIIEDDSHIGDILFFAQ